MEDLYSEMMMGKRVAWNDLLEMIMRRCHRNSFKIPTNALLMWDMDLRRESSPILPSAATQGADRLAAGDSSVGPIPASTSVGHGFMVGRSEASGLRWRAAQEPESWTRIAVTLWSVVLVPARRCPVRGRFRGLVGTRRRCPHPTCRCLA